MSASSLNHPEGVRNDVDRCRLCGQSVTLDCDLVLAAILDAAALDGHPSSASGMTIEEIVSYVRQLELRWMADQRTIYRSQRYYRKAV
ncbi:MAG: hypothetical protein ACYDAG_15320 [Chloroflexota bacterium]